MLLISPVYVEGYLRRTDLVMHTVVGGQEFASGTNGRKLRALLVFFLVIGKRAVREMLQVHLRRNLAHNYEVGRSIDKLKSYNKG